MLMKWKTSSRALEKRIRRNSSFHKPIDRQSCRHVKGAPVFDSVSIPFHSPYIKTYNKVEWHLLSLYIYPTSLTFIRENNKREILDLSRSLRAGGVSSCGQLRCVLRSVLHIVFSCVRESPTFHAWLAAPYYNKILASLNQTRPRKY